ncbi:proline dehydrogenase [Pseudocyphellaria aurata]|nr:proline dehydrogenase [Pseudocyphellaria aurata]
MKPAARVAPNSPMWFLHRRLRMVRVDPRTWHRTFDANFTHRAPPAATAPAKHLIPQSKEALSPLSKSSQPPLSLLPFRVLIRSYLIAALSSSPRLLTPSLGLLSILAKSQSPWLNPDRNPLVRYILRKTIYAHFCAGETLKDVRRTLSGLKRIGYRGVILAHAREIVLPAGKNATAEEKVDDLAAGMDVETWKQSNLDTLSMVEEGDFIAVKFSGAGPQVVQQLAEEAHPAKRMDDAMIAICNVAKRKRVGLLIDAEQSFLQAGIDSWMLRYQRKYNLGEAVVYGTYQAYRQSTPETLSRHLSIAQDEGFTLGVKLVRGAYMGSDLRHLFWNSKEETDRTYNGIAAALIGSEFNDVLRSSRAAKTVEFPKAKLLLATHNHVSVQKAMELQKEQAAKRQARFDLSYGQLMGMADEVSCELVMAGIQSKDSEASQKLKLGVPLAYKYLPWGSVGECMMYLVRRAEENRSAVERTEGACSALKVEIGRRVFGM